MKELWKVHSFTVEKVVVPAKTAEGAVVEGLIPCAIIELAPMQTHGRSHTVHRAASTPAALDELRKNFPIGGIVADRGWELVATPEQAKAHEKASEKS